MKRTLLIAIAACIAGAAGAQQGWQGVYSHNGYSCYLLGTATNPTALAGKTTDAGGYTLLMVKFKSPYRWNNTEYAGVKITKIDLSSNQRYSSEILFYYKNGWIYVSDYYFDVCAPHPCYTYTVTVYKNNDSGRIKGESKTLNLNLGSLNVLRLPYSDKPFETFW